MRNLVFIIGTGRCGSSFVHEVLAKHEEMGFISNIEDNIRFINRHGRWNNYLYRTFLGNFTRKGGVRFAPSEAYKLISREVSMIYANSHRDLLGSDVTPWIEKRFQNFFKVRNDVQNKQVFSHKYTGWPRIEFFQEIFPDAKFINIVRDGRAVANSWLQMDWWGGYRGSENWLWGRLPEELEEVWKAAGQDYAHLAGISWKILMEAFHRAETKISSEKYLKLRYEDILENPEDEFKKMIEFCDLEWSSQFDKQFSKQKISKSRSRSFEKDLTATQLDLIEHTLSDLLEQYGYK